MSEECPGNAVAKWWRIIRRALITAFVVGPVLGVINHGDSLVAGEVDGRDGLKILLSFLVPFCVSLSSSVFAVRERRRLDGHAQRSAT
jgi:hypothetical protein